MKMKYVQIINFKNYCFSGKNYCCNDNVYWVYIKNIILSVFHVWIQIKEK